MRVAIFASGNGTNFEALAQAFKNHQIENGELVLLFCDHPNAPVIKRAQRLGISYETFSLKQFKKKTEYEKQILKVLREYNVEFIALAGYMRVIGPTLLNQYPQRIINLHPAYLPEFQGLHAIERAYEDHLKNGRKQTGVTLHFIDEGLDTGPIIEQCHVPIKDDDTLDSLEQRIHENEHQMYPQILNHVINQINKGEKIMKRALISVSNKTNLISFARGLVKNGYEIISTGGTQKFLEEVGISTIGIEEITHFPEILDGRVKTLHPSVHAGLLAKRDNKTHMETLADHQIEPIDLVCVNLYPFKETVKKPNVSFDDAIEQIDIGGPSMLRAAAKNFKDVTVVTDLADYDRVLDEIQNKGKTTLETRKELAAKVFQQTAAYDALIAQYLDDQVDEIAPENLTLPYQLKQIMRYGENSHQRAWFYEDVIPKEFSISQAKQLHGKHLSYNNIKDADASLRIIREFDEPTVVGLKHMNPCGIGRGKTIEEAWDRAYDADPVSIFGGIVALNRPVDLATATKLHKLFLEIIIAPSFDDDAYEILAKKKNLRLLTLDFGQKDEQPRLETVSVMGGMLMQEQDILDENPTQWEVVTKAKPTSEQLKTMEFAWKTVKFVKSNAILVANQNQTIGVGAGQPNRIDAVKIAIEHAQEKITDQSVLASDAFFPMNDSVQYAAEHGIKLIIQPGGSIRDQDSIDMADKYGIAMVMTGNRHFRH